MSEEIAKLVAKHPSAKAGRNYGLGAGIDLGDKHGNFLFNMHEPSEGLEILRSDLRDNGLITLFRGHHMHCAPPLIITPEEIRECFELFDKSGIGKIPSNDLGMVLRSLKPDFTESELNKNLTKSLVDKDGTIDFDNFVKLVCKMQDLQTEHDYIKAFQVLDKDGDGLMKFHEIKEALQSLGENLPDEAVNEMIRGPDADHSGDISCEEFVTTMLKAQG